MAIRWYASALLQDKLTLYPGKSLVHNIGNVGSGEHCSENKVYDSILNMNPVKLDDLVIEEDETAFNQFCLFLKKRKRNMITQV